MNVVVALEHRFEQTPDGAVWTQTQCAYPFWQRYLAVFDSVTAVARVRPVTEPPAGWLRADGDQVRFAPLPYYVGPVQYLFKAGAVKRAAQAAVAPGDAVILRVPSQVANCLEPLLRRRGQPYAVEVVGDPYDVFAPGSVKHPLRPFFRWWLPRQLRRVCHGAAAAAYVTADALQRRYPCPAHMVGFSDVELPGTAFAAAPRPARQGGPLNLVFVGTLAQMYKAPDVLIDAVRLASGRGLDLRLTLIGDGKHRPELEARATAAGLNGHARFLGQLAAGDLVRARLDESDLFVLASHQEGLPRAMVEAMARGLPCVGSDVGGIPELLPPEDRVPPGNAEALAAKFAEVADPERLATMSARNLERARDYRDEVIRERRLAFYRRVRAITDNQNPSR